MSYKRHDFEYKITKKRLNASICSTNAMSLSTKLLKTRLNASIWPTNAMSLSAKGFEVEACEGDDEKKLRTEMMRYSPHTT